MTAPGLTARQADGAGPSLRAMQAFAFIVKRVSATGVPPSYEEISDKLNLGSKSQVWKLIIELEVYGYIGRRIARARAIEVLKHPPPHAVPIGTLIVQAMKAPVPVAILRATKTNLRVPEKRAA